MATFYLGASYSELGQAEAAEDDTDKVELYTRIAGLWIERFANYNQATQPLERVVAIDPDQTGQLRVADRPYDRMVAGVISGAGGRFGTQHSAAGESWFMGQPGLRVVLGHVEFALHILARTQSRRLGIPGQTGRRVAAVPGQ